MKPFSAVALALTLGLAAPISLASPLSPAPFRLAQANPLVQAKVDDYARRLVQIEGFVASQDEDRTLEASQLLVSFVRREQALLDQHPDTPALTARFWPHRLRLVPLYLEMATLAAKAGRQGGVQQNTAFAKAEVDDYRAWSGHDPATLTALDAQLRNGQATKTAASQPAAAKPGPAGGKPVPGKPGPATAQPAGEVDAETAARRLPQNYYRGRDIPQLTAQIKAAWARVYPRDKVLAVRFPEDNWEDRSRNDYNSVVNEWQRFNHQRMRAVVILQETPKIAVFYTITMVKRPGRGVEVQVDSNEKAQDNDPYRMLISNIR